MGRETVVLVLAALLLALAVHRLVWVTQHRGAPSLAHQGAFGLCCGLLGAVVAAVPYADVVPDAWEGALLAGIVVAILALVAAEAVRRLRRLRRRRARAPRPVRLTDRSAAAGPARRAPRRAAGTAARSGRLDRPRGAAAP